MACSRIFPTEDGDKTAKRFLLFSTSVGPTVTVVDKKLFEEKYSEQFEALFDEVKRTWISATSNCFGWSVNQSDHSSPGIQENICVELSDTSETNRWCR